MKTFGRITIAIAAMGVLYGLVLVVRSQFPESLVIFFLKLAIAAVPLAALARWAHIYPTEPLVLLGLAPVLLSLGAGYSSGWLWAALAVDVVLIVIVLCDLVTLPAVDDFVIVREALRIASLRKDHLVTLTITNQSDQTYRVAVRDGVPLDLDPQPEQFPLQLPGLSRTVVEYRLRPKRRGAFLLSQTFVRVRSRLRLWQRFMTYEAPTQVHVYPDLKQLSEYALLARTNRLSLMGLRRTRRIGQDNEFERLRDYTLDDNYKHIDWRSTARRNRLTVRDFQANHNQRVVFLIDCGRMMTNQAAGLSLLDHSLNAMLMLSYVALSHGDSVGLLLFSDEIHAFIPPSGGMKHMNRLLHASFDRFPRLVESRYDDAFLHLGTHCRKRSLVVLISSVIDEVNAHQLSRQLSTISGRHLPLGVLLRDRRMFDALERDDGDDESLYRAGAAAEILSWRQQVLTDLHYKGVLSIDVFPEDLTAPLVNRYLDVKAKHLL